MKILLKTILTMSYVLKGIFFVSSGRQPWVMSTGKEKKGSHYTYPLIQCPLSLGNFYFMNGFLLHQLFCTLLFHMDNASSFVPRIIKGTPVDPNDTLLFPYHINLGNKKEAQWSVFCGGAIISEKWELKLIFAYCSLTVVFQLQVCNHRRPLFPKFEDL